MPGRKLILPNWTLETPDASGALAHMGKIDLALAILAEALGGFAPYCSTPPDMTVKLGPGRLANSLGLAINSFGSWSIVNGGKAAETIVAAQGVQSIALAAPSGAPRISRIALNPSTGAAVEFAGAEAAIPAAPALPPGWLPVAQVLLAPGQTAITGAHITDERVMALLTAQVEGSHKGITIVSEKYCRVAVFAPEPRFIGGHGGVDLSTSFTPPAGATQMRVTAISPGGGGGGGWCAGTGLSPQLASGGGGGGGGMVSRLWAAEALSIVVPCGGVGGGGSIAGANNSTAGTAGAATTVTGTTSGLSIAPGGGGGGGRGVSTPAAGAAGAAGSAPADGFAGGAGQAGYLGTVSSTAARKGGSVGEQGQFRPQSNWDGAVAGILSIPGAPEWGCGGMASVATSIDGAYNYGGDGGMGGDGMVIVEWW